MTHAARLTQKRLEGEIGNLLRGEAAYLYHLPCVFCDAYYQDDCDKCPIFIGNGKLHCRKGNLRRIGNSMWKCKPSAIPGALAIYLWLFEL